MSNQKNKPILLGVLSLALFVTGCVDKRKNVVQEDSSQESNVPAVPQAGSNTDDPTVAVVDDQLIPLKDLPETDEGWRKKLAPEVFEVAREKGTEEPGTNKYNKHYKDGIYRCACCGERLFDSATKYDSGSGWPAFWKPYNTEVVQEENDDTFFSSRIEVLCKRCGAHLGHVFDDGPEDQTGLRYCINSVSMQFQAREEIAIAPQAPKPKPKKEPETKAVE